MILVKQTWENMRRDPTCDARSQSKKSYSWIPANPASGGRVLTRPWISLKFSWFLSAINWNKTDSVVVKIAPAWRNLDKANSRSTFDLRRRERERDQGLSRSPQNRPNFFQVQHQPCYYRDEVASATKNTSIPLLSKSRTVCWTQTWVSTPNKTI